MAARKSSGIRVGVKLSAWMTGETSVTRKAWVPSNFAATISQMIELLPRRSPP